MKVLATAIIGLFLALATAQQVHAHALQPGYLELQLLGGENWRAFWRKPTVQNKPMAIDVALPENCTERTPPSPVFDGAAWVAQWVTTCPGGLAGGVIAIPGLEVTRTDVLVRYELSPSAGQARRLTPAQPSFVVPADPGVLDVLASYFFLGVEHILEGFDHLLFVFAFLLLIADRMKLLGAITAFTVAHSITMAAATFGLVTLPGPPVEAVIALSIMFLAYELLQRDGDTSRLSQRYPWLVSFVFGLLHGFGFAGALQEIGLPQGDIPLALLAFNLGVEAGQIVFIAAVLIAGAVIAHFAPVMMRTMRTAQSPASLACAYVIGGLASYWLVARIAAF